MFSYDQRHTAFNTSPLMINLLTNNMNIKSLISSQNVGVLNRINWLLFTIPRPWIIACTVLYVLVLAFIATQGHSWPSLALAALAFAYCLIYAYSIIYDDVMIVRPLFQFRLDTVSAHVRGGKGGLRKRFGPKTIQDVYQPLLAALKEAGCSSVKLESPNNRLIKYMKLHNLRKNGGATIVSKDLTPGRLGFLKSFFFRISLREVMKEDDGRLLKNKGFRLPLEGYEIDLTSSIFS